MHMSMIEVLESILGTKDKTSKKNDDASWESVK